MRYNFTAEQIADPQMGPAAKAVQIHGGREFFARQA